MTQEIEIVNKRVLKMLNNGEITSEVFFRDVRTLTELVSYLLEEEIANGEDGV